MSLIYRENCEGIDWDAVVALLTKVGMSTTDVIKHKVSFENSFAVIFVFDENKMIGMGRSISDGVRQSALYDIAIDADYQGRGIGKKIVNALVDKTPDCNFILYASPRKEAFYIKLGFKRMRTGMALFSDSKRMIDGGFVEE